MSIKNLFAMGVLTVSLIFGANLAGASTNLPSTGRIVVPAIFSENMVLQRAVPIPVWGWGPEGEEISVYIADENLQSLQQGRSARQSVPLSCAVRS